MSSGLTAHLRALVSVTFTPAKKRRGAATGKARAITAKIVDRDTKTAVMKNEQV